VRGRGKRDREKEHKVALLAAAEQLKGITRFAEKFTKKSGSRERKEVPGRGEVDLSRREGNKNEGFNSAGSSFGTLRGDIIPKTKEKGEHLPDIPKWGSRQQLRTKSACSHSNFASKGTGSMTKSSRVIQAKQNNKRGGRGKGKKLALHDV